MSEPTVRRPTNPKRGGVLGVMTQGLRGVGNCAIWFLRQEVRLGACGPIRGLAGAATEGVREERNGFCRVLRGLRLQRLRCLGVSVGWRRC